MLTCCAHLCSGFSQVWCVMGFEFLLVYSLACRPIAGPSEVVPLQIQYYPWTHPLRSQSKLKGDLVTSAHGEDTCVLLRGVCISVTQHSCTTLSICQVCVCAFMHLRTTWFQLDVKYTVHRFIITQTSHRIQWQLILTCIKTRTKCTAC